MDYYFLGRICEKLFVIFFVMLTKFQVGIILYSVVMLEDEILYGRTFPVAPEVLSPDFVIPIGKAKIEVPGDDVTIVSYGKSMAQAFKGTEELAKQGIHAEVLFYLFFFFFFFV